MTVDMRPERDGADPVPEASGVILVLAIVLALAVLALLAI